MTIKRLASRRTLSAAALVLASVAGQCANAQEAIDPDAASVLAAMSGYLGGLQSFTADYNVDIDVITQQGEKLEFSSSGALAVQRPSHLHVTRTGMVVDAEMFLDGSNLTIFGKNLNGYIQLPATSIDEAIEVLRNETDIDAPGADLLSSTPLAADVTDVVSGTHVGMAYVDGVEVHHLAFRGKNVDWQLWVQNGDQPLPLKYVITSKWISGSPQYTLRFNNWNPAPTIDAAAFTFSPPADATELESFAVDQLGALTIGQE
jgi:hypothetical protein